MENAHSLHGSLHCSMASEVMESFPLCFLFLPIKQIFQDGHFCHLAFELQIVVAAGKVNFY